MCCDDHCYIWHGRRVCVYERCVSALRPCGCTDAVTQSWPGASVRMSLPRIQHVTTLCISVCNILAHELWVFYPTLLLSVWKTVPEKEKQTCLVLCFIWRRIWYTVVWGKKWVKTDAVCFDWNCTVTDKYRPRWYKQTPRIKSTALAYNMALYYC